MTKEKTLMVSAIKNGTVIDHIPVGQGLKIIKILGYSNYDKLFTVGLNLKSKKMKLKDIIKVSEKEITEDELDCISIFAPSATINIIRNYKHVKKLNPKIPEKIDSLLTCPNPKCITNHEILETSFKVNLSKNTVKVKCKYCERTFLLDEIEN